MIYLGAEQQNKAMDRGRRLNAQLPLPKSEGEVDKFRNITGFEYVWIGVRDLTKSGDRSKWKDVEGNSIGNVYVNLRVIF